MATHSKQLRELALFAGGGGGLLASQHIHGWRTVCYVEKDPYAVAILKARIADGLLHDAPIWGDVTTFSGEVWRGYVDIITAGFPCQPFSVAGKRLAEKDDRNLWPATAQVIRAVRPKHIFLENAPVLTTYRYFDTILIDLAEAGYDVQWGVLGAIDLGAPHHRKRLWMRATNSECSRLERSESERRIESIDTKLSHCCCNASNTNRESIRIEQISECGCEVSPKPFWPSGGEAECGVDRVADGVAHRVDRIRATGNGQVPIVAATAWELLE